jgi:hypothetical protein
MEARLPKQETVTQELALHNEHLNQSIMVSEFGEGGKVFPLPKSQIEYRMLRGKYVTATDGRKLPIIEVEMPEWIAKDRGLI